MKARAGESETRPYEGRLRLRAVRKPPRISGNPSEITREYVRRVFNNRGSLTQKEVARRLGTSVNRLKKYLRGESRVRNDISCLLSAQCSLCVIVPEHADSESPRTIGQGIIGAAFARNGNTNSQIASTS
jgi:hypothetical protein